MQTTSAHTADRDDLKLACIPPLLAVVGWCLVLEEMLVGRIGGHAFDLGAMAVILGSVGAIPALVVTFMAAVSAALSRRPRVPILITGFALIGNLATLLFPTWVVWGFSA